MRNSNTIIKIIHKRYKKHNQRFWKYVILHSKTPDLDYNKIFQIPAKQVKKYLQPANDAIKILYGQDAKTG